MCKITRLKLGESLFFSRLPVTLEGEGEKEEEATTAIVGEKKEEGKKKRGVIG